MLSKKRSVNFTTDQWNLGYKKNCMYSKEMYSTHNEGKSVVAKWFIRILKNKYKSIHKYMTLISKMVYNNELEDY